MAISDVFKEKSKNARSSRKEKEEALRRFLRFFSSNKVPRCQGKANLNCFNFIPRFQYFNRNKLTIFLKISYLQVGFKIDT